MTDRFESLLSELVELQRKQLANQEVALARQEKALVVQQQAVERQRKAVRLTWMFLAVVLLMLLLVPLLNVAGRMTR